MRATSSTWKAAAPPTESETRAARGEVSRLPHVDHATLCARGAVRPRAARAALPPSARHAADGATPGGGGGGGGGGGHRDRLRNGSATRSGGDGARSSSARAVAGRRARVRNGCARRRRVPASRGDRRSAEIKRAREKAAVARALDELLQQGDPPALGARVLDRDPRVGPRARARRGLGAAARDAGALRATARHGRRRRRRPAGAGGDGGARAATIAPDRGVLLGGDRRRWAPTTTPATARCCARWRPTARGRTVFHATRPRSRRARRRARSRPRSRSSRRRARSSRRTARASSSTRPRARSTATPRARALLVEMAARGVEPDVYSPRRRSRRRPRGRVGGGGGALLDEMDATAGLSPNVVSFSAARARRRLGRRRRAARQDEGRRARAERVLVHLGDLGGRARRARRRARCSARCRRAELPAGPPPARQRNPRPRAPRTGDGRSAPLAARRDGDAIKAPTPTCARTRRRSRRRTARAAGWDPCRDIDWSARAARRRAHAKSNAMSAGSRRRRGRGDPRGGAQSLEAASASSGRPGQCEQVEVERFNAEPEIRGFAGGTVPDERGVMGRRPRTTTGPRRGGRRWPRQ